MVVAIIGIIAAILIPNLLDAIHKAKQKRSVSDIRNIGIAWMVWTTDQISAGAAGSETTNLDWGEDLPNTLSAEEIIGLLEGDEDGNATYLSNMPTLDGWGNELDFAAVFSIADPSSYNQLITSARAVAAVSVATATRT